MSELTKWSYLFSCRLGCNRKFSTLDFLLPRLAPNEAQSPSYVAITAKYCSSICPWRNAKIGSIEKILNFFFEFNEENQVNHINWTSFNKIKPDLTTCYVTNYRIWPLSSWSKFTRTKYGHYVQTVWSSFILELKILFLKPSRMFQAWSFDLLLRIKMVNIQGISFSPKASSLNWRSLHPWYRFLVHITN